MSDDMQKPMGDDQQTPMTPPAMAPEGAEGEEEKEEGGEATMPATEENN